MSLSAHAGANISNYVYTGTAETGGIVEDFSKGVTTTNEDRGYDPATGKTVFYGNHCSEERTGTINFITLSGGLMNAVVGNTITLSTSLAVAGHTGNTTTVVTGINLSKNNAGGQAQRGSLDYVALPF